MPILRKRKAPAYAEAGRRSGTPDPFIKSILLRYTKKIKAIYQPTAAPAGAGAAVTPTKLLLKNCRILSIFRV